VVGHRTGGIGTTGILHTWVYALIIAAGLGGTAVIIHMAAIHALVVQANVTQEAIVVHSTGH